MRCVGSLWATIGHLRVTVGYPRVTIGHLRVTMGHLGLTIGYLKATLVHSRVTLGHLRVTKGYFFSLSKHKANATELHPKVRQTCYMCSAMEVGSIYHNKIPPRVTCFVLLTV